ncbi:hypothetical protein VE26_10750 [Devosia chinhatensis]|uniref:Uncharacterized protein n=1 Tax=Devosia chinhatensis TaxID=429727 RepID=A0A0F5FED3_9HYPH|nr:hypothetical protein VE26_10750 [Devosia chinhatensis]
MVPALSATLFGMHEACPFQHAEMLHDGAAIQIREHRNKGASGLGGLLKMIEKAAAHAVAQRLENEVVFIVI